jgi:hypothetical protein
MTTAAQTQLLLPEKVNHTDDGVCDVIEYPDVNPALFNFFKSSYAISDYQIYFSSYLPLPKSDYIKMLNYLKKNGDVGSYETFTKDLEHEGIIYYVTLLRDQKGMFYDILIDQGDENTLQFRPKYYQCEAVGKKNIEWYDVEPDQVKKAMEKAPSLVIEAGKYYKIHQFSNRLYSKISYDIDRKVVDIIDEPRHLEFKMNDGSSLIYEFCHKDPDGDYHEYSMIDTFDDAIYKIYKTDLTACNHKHVCKILP